MKKAIFSQGLVSLLIVWGISAALIVALFHQIAYHDLPCALCWLQRFAMLAIAVAQGYLLIRIGRSQPVSLAETAAAHGLSIIAALVGMSISMRQVLLHIMPDDPGYGGVVLGLHFYTWAFVLFFICTVGSAVALALSSWLDREAETWRVAARRTVGLVAVLVLVNWALVFAMQGFQWELDGDPTHYRLLSGV